MKGERLRASLGMLLQTSKPFSQAGQIRFLHKTRPAPPIPRPVPFVPDVPTFLTLIGRGLNKYANKFPSWDALFSLTSPQLRELGIEPARSRRYLLQWMQRYRKGALGPGGDFQYVENGEAILKIATPPAAMLNGGKFAVNVPHGVSTDAAAPTTLPRPAGYRVEGLKTIVGPYAKPLPGLSGAVVKVTEGMWEHRQGRKIDGGERRRAEVRFKKRSAERRAEREAEMLSHL
ncbi:IGR protein motif-domain-containing protein [Dactylonectria macrodidyma]|uniref:Small ribosomal subunit protein mS41 n=1 Tax=Dactylonectria macrodidyma TaxID=307937 RepID=A0A9P9FPN0_9HYPO|nr:IGR protein motif-domain-containing protein [Dactylonectria macrodidyma]